MRTFRRCAQALADGTIDVIGTDHAPHPSESKDCEWAQAAMGMTGLETALSVVQHTMIESGLIGWADFARVTSHTPARIGRLGSQGRPLQEGRAGPSGPGGPGGALDGGTGGNGH